jgi:L-methionine (R)-S-oxide reductase
MAETLYIPVNASRKEIYESLVPQIEGLLSGETDEIANLSNFVAALKEAFDFFWVGFYIKRANQLVLGPFQGPIACTRIHFDKGVCGFCYRSKETVIVPNVEEFPGHIACSSASKSEIVLPVFDKKGEVSMVLDVDSNKLDDFSAIDKEGLEQLVKILEKALF